MKLLKILVIIFLIYFIRRFVQMYRALKTLQDNQTSQGQNQNQNPHMHKSTDDKVVDADFKVID